MVQTDEDGEKSILDWLGHPIGNTNHCHDFLWRLKRTLLLSTIGALSHLPFLTF